jgi:acyl-CoA-binding protein
MAGALERKHMLFVAALVSLAAVTAGYYYVRKKAKRKDEEDIVWDEDEDPSPEARRFRLAAKAFQKLILADSVDRAALLRAYGLYKQATEGDCSGRCPMLDPVAAAKWRAWNSNKGLAKENARDEYSDFIFSLLSDEDKAAFLEGKDSGGGGLGIGVSCLQGGDNGDRDESVVGRFCEAIVADRFDLVQQQLSANPSLVNGVDKDTMRPLHWAADRGNVEITKFLLDKGAEVDAVDEDGNTALHQAVLAEQREVCSLLLSYGAVATIPNADGENALNLAQGTPLQNLRWF